jgi:hypothetical protein
MLGQQVDVLLCHAPVPPYTVKAAYQHHIHLSGKDGLHHLLQSRTVKGHSRAMLGGSTNDGVPGLLRIAAKLLGLPFQRKAIEWRIEMRKAIVITLGVIISVTGVLAICAHLADAARLALYVPEDEDDDDIY